MKIQIDFDLKTIKLENSTNISKLMAQLNKIIPQDEFEQYTLETNTVIQWNSYPVYKYYPDWNHYYPYYGTTTLLGNTKSNSALNGITNASTSSLSTNNVTMELSGKKNFEV